MDNTDVTITYNMIVKGQQQVKEVVNTNKQLAGTVKENITQSNKFGGSLNGLAMRFIGLNAIVSQGMQKFRELQQWVGESIEKYREFEKNIAEVSTILSGEGLKSINALEGGIENLSKTYGKSANDLAEGTYQILSAAFEVDEAMNLLNTSTKASIAGLTDVATSVDVFTSILNSYGKTVYQATELSDQLFQTVVRGKLRFEDLASSIGYITPIAASAGVEMKEILAALSTVTRMGVHVDMASRGLALGIQGIVSPTEMASKAARKYGVDMSALALQVNGLEGFLHDLNEAMEEHGSAILPEMIRNMRSLRVFSVLAGEEGILGFTKDLDLLAESAGRTDDALSQMMKATQTEADILAQSMEYLERRVGEAWSSFDLWKTKASIWWGTFFTGGDASAALKEIDDNISDINKNYLTIMANAERMKGKPSLFEALMGGLAGATSVGGVTAPSLDSIYDRLVDDEVISNINKYIEKEKELVEIGEKSGKLYEFKNLISLKESDIKEVIPDTDIWSRLFSLEDTRVTGSKIKEKLKEIAPDYSDIIDMMNLKDDMGYYITEHSIESLLSDLDTLAQEYVDASGKIKGEMASSEDIVNWYISGFQNASDTINKHKENIMSLVLAMRGLKREVETEYVSIGGQSFTGTMDRDIAVFKAETELSRSQTYTNMAMKYGSQYLNEYNDSITETGQSLHSLIQYVNEYEEAQKAVNEVIDEQNNIIKINSIKMLELEIAGMSRRRGLTRQEQKIIKQLELENAKARLETMKESYKQESNFNDTAYNDAMEQINKFYDMQSLAIFEMKDIRDQELLDMEADYQYQKDLLADYRIDYTTQMELLNDANETYRLLMEKMTPEITEHMEDLWGEDALTHLNNMTEAMNKYNEQLYKTDEEFGTPSSTTPTSGSEILAGVIDKAPEGRIRDTLKNFQDYTLGKRSFSRGTNYIPETGMYHLHRREKVISPGESSESPIYITINNNNSISNDVDAERVANLMAQTITMRLSDKTGKSKYRFR
jgi:TP901 family phage tail tape measure protein